jgi:protein ImuA
MPALAHHRPVEEPPACTLADLRSMLARIERVHVPLSESGVLPTGLAVLDAHIGGGLARDGVHEFAAAHPVDLPAATGLVAFLVRLAAQSAGRRRPVVWVADEMTLREAGYPCAAGLVSGGPDPARLVMVRTRHRTETFWALEEALRAGVCAAVVADLWDEGRPLDLTASRRLSLAAGQAGTPLFLLRPRPCPAPLPATTRFVVAARPAGTDRHVLAPPRLHLSLVRSRAGAPGDWIVEVVRHESSLRLAPATDDVAPAAGPLSGAVVASARLRSAVAQAG